MSRVFDIFPPEVAYQRQVLFAVEVLDGVTLQRLSQGLKVTAQGLKYPARTNSSGRFVWLQEDLSSLQMLSIDPGVLPCEKRDLSPSDLQKPLWQVQLAPTCSYPFVNGMTGFLGRLIEDRVAVPDPAEPVVQAALYLSWLSIDGTTWVDAPLVSHSNANGDFAVVIRFTPKDEPQVTAGALAVRLRATRDLGGPQLSTGKFSIQLGRVADARTYLQQGGAPPALVFAWNELQP